MLCALSLFAAVLVLLLFLVLVLLSLVPLVFVTVRVMLMLIITFVRTGAVIVRHRQAVLTQQGLGFLEPPPLAFPLAGLAWLRRLLHLAAARSPPGILPGYSRRVRTAELQVEQLTDSA